MHRLITFYVPAITIGLLASAAAAEVSEHARSSIDRVIGHKGTYVPEEGVYKITLPREEAVLSMNRTVTTGVYKAAIGTRTLLNRELVVREMGMSTWISIAGTNEHALAQGEFVESPNGLRKLLTALRARGMNISSIRNHTVGEHPQSIFIRFCGRGTAIQLAKAVRYALDVQVGAVSPGSGQKI